MTEFLRHNTGRLFGWGALFIAAGCFFGQYGVGVIAAILVLVQVFL